MLYSYICHYTDIIYIYSTCLFIYIYIHIIYITYIIIFLRYWRDSRHRTLKSRMPKIFWLKKCIITFLLKKCILRSSQRVPLQVGCPPNNVHVHPQLRNTLSPRGHILISISFLSFKFKRKIDWKLIEFNWNPYLSFRFKRKINWNWIDFNWILTYPLDLKGKSIESKLISIEILTEHLMNPNFLFCLSLFGRDNLLKDLDLLGQGGAVD